LMGSRILRRRNGLVCAAFSGLGSFVLLAALSTVAMGVTEQDIGASGPAVTGPTVAQPQVTHPGPGESAAQNDAMTQAEVASRAHPTIPYTIRPGDTLGSIAATFGVAVADIARTNRISPDDELTAGQTLRIPNPFVARERSLIEEIGETSTARQVAEQKAATSEAKVAALMGQFEELRTEREQSEHDLRALPWWRALALSAAVGAFLMLGAMVTAVVEWAMLRGRFRAAAEMNESLRRLDYKYKGQLAKAELRLQALYGRRRRGIQDGQDRPKIAEEIEIEALNRQLKEILERHLERLKPPSESARRARWRELIAGVGSPVEARSLRR